MAATGPTWRQPRLAPIWPRSWRSTPRCPSITQASTLKCLESACLLQRCPPAKPHPKPLKVREKGRCSFCDSSTNTHEAHSVPALTFIVSQLLCSNHKLTFLLLQVSPRFPSQRHPASLSTVTERARPMTTPTMPRPLTWPPLQS